MSDTDLVIFDLGKVLLDFDFRKVVEGLARHSSRTEDEIKHYFITTHLWDAFERGGVGPEDFFQGLRRDLALKDLDFEAFVPLWNEIFTEKADTIAILNELRGRYRLAMISNVNPMHWDYVNRRHAFMRWFDYPVASYAVGYRKPEPEIFLGVLKQAGVPASRAVFIDDVPSHITAARSLGLRAHQFLSADQLRIDLNGVLQ